MRLNLRLTSSEEPVPFDHLHQLTGTIHKWLGARNPEHNGPSLYSFSWLNGAKPSSGSLTFPHGATWTISLHSDDASRRLLEGILEDPQVAYGMRVFETREQAPPAFGERYHFKVAGPVLARMRRDDNRRDNLLWDDPRANTALTRVLRRKLEIAGYTGDHLNASVAFDSTYRGARSKLVTIKGISHRTSLCPVIVEGTPEAVRFAWLVGAGELTGSGLGAVW